MLQGIENISLSIPAFTSITIQLWLLANSDKRKLINKNWPILLFFIGVFGISFIEFLTYSGIVSPSLFLMKMFYILCSLAFSGLLILSITLSGIEIFNTKTAKTTLLSLCAVFSLTMLATSSLISNIVSIGYSVSRTPGDYYFIVQFYGAALIVFTIFFLTIGAKNTENNYVKKRSKFLLFSTTPFLFVFLILLVLMAFGVKINASVIVPISTTYMLMVLIITEQKENLFSLLLRMPYTSESKSFKQITTLIEDFLVDADTGETSSLKSLTTNIEQQIVSIAVQMSNGSQIKAASLLNVSPSSICRKNK